MDKLKELGNEYVKLHDFIQEKGCKGSCRSWSCGVKTNLEYTFDPDQKLLYFFAFGGYCIGDCHRWHEVEAGTEEEVVLKVSKIFKDCRIEEASWQRAQGTYKAP